jgi:hypothetical protein
MKKISLIIGLLLIIIAILMVLPIGSQLMAVDGCCKQRNSYSENWRRSRLNYPQCRQLNQQRDGDNIFDQSGLVWWDVRCR